MARIRTVRDENLAPEPDERFDMRVERFINGSWSVENGALARLGEELRAVNAVSFRAVAVVLTTYRRIAFQRGGPYDRGA